MDRKDALYFYLLSVGGSWVAVLVALIPNQEYASVYGTNLLGIAAIICAVGAVGGIFVYRYWPSESARQAKIEKDMIKRHMNRVQEEMKADRLRDLAVTEFEVAWHLSRDMQPSPHYGTQDVPGSDKASKLLVTQDGHSLTFKGTMKHLRPSYLYMGYIGNAAKPNSLPAIFDERTPPNPVVSRYPHVTFTTDENGGYEWVIRTSTDILAQEGIIDNRMSVWINDAHLDKTVLVTDNFTVIPQ